MLYGVWRSSEQPATVLDGPVTALVAPKPGATTDQPTSSSPSASSQPPSTAPATGAGRGPGVTEPGGRVAARPDASGDLEVVAWVRLSRPLREVALALPQDFGITPVARPTVVDLQAVADGQVVAVPDNGTVRQRVNLVLPQLADTLQLRYRLVDAVQRSRPAPPGRALIMLAPLKVEALAALPVTMQVSGARVTNLTCPLLPQPQQLCGRQDAQAWFTPALAADQAVVIVQADLPNPT